MKLNELKKSSLLYMRMKRLKIILVMKTYTWAPSRKVLLYMFILIRERDTVAVEIKM